MQANVKNITFLTDLTALLFESPATLVCNASIFKKEHTGMSVSAASIMNLCPSLSVQVGKTSCPYFYELPHYSVWQ